LGEALESFSLREGARDVAAASGTGQPDDKSPASPPVVRAYTFSRRDLLRYSAVGGVALGAGTLLDACGGSSSGAAPTQSTTASAAAGTPKRGGTLRIGISAGGPTDAINPLLPGLPTDYGRIPQIYEPLIAWDDNLQPIPYLAESMTSNSDATEWTIKVRKGVTFHDGKPLTAEDVIYTFQQILNPKAPGYGASPLALVDAKNIKKVDSHTLTIPCTAPFSTLMETLPVYDFAVIPVGFNPKKPNGTGPFVLKSFSPGQQSVMVRNPHYWQSGLPYLDELIMIDFADETSQTQALASGQVDAINLLSAASIGAVTSAKNQVVISNGGGFSPWTMRVDQAPFDDVRVRQAMRLMIDRKELVDVVFDGHGLIGNDIFSYYDAGYDHSLPQRVQDIDQAKSLLKSAGHAGMTTELVIAPQAQGAIEAAQIFKQQAAQAGVTINLRQITTTAFDNIYTKVTFANSFWFYNPYFEEVGLATLASGPFNETHFNDAKYAKLYGQGLATTNQATRTEITHEMQTIDYNTGGYIIPCFIPIIEALSTKVHGDKPGKSGLSFNNWDLKSLWID
jgi:peptide/nickel transport system substrate-binding protein